MSEEVKTVNLKLDKNSLSVLRNVDPIHRESLINLGISLVSKTQYYKTLCGNVPENANTLEDISSISTIDNNTPQPVQNNTQIVKSAPQPKSTSSWDDF